MSPKKVDTISFYLTKNGYQIIELIKLSTKNNQKYYYKVKHPYGMILFVEDNNNNNYEQEEKNISILRYTELEKNEKSISDNLKNGIFQECNKNSVVIIKDQLLSLVLVNNKSIEPIIENYALFKNKNDSLIEGYFVFPIVSILEIKNDPETVERHVIILTACLRKYMINRIERHYKSFLNSNQKIKEHCSKYEDNKKNICKMLSEKIGSGYEEVNILKSKNKNIDGVALQNSHALQNSQDFQNLSNLNDVGLIYLDEISKMERLAKDIKKIEKELKQSIEKLNDIKKSQSQS